MSEYRLPARRRLYVMRHGDVTCFDGTGQAIAPDTAPRDRVVRMLNHATPSPLHRDTRNTTMEMLYAQYLRYRPHG